MWLILKQQAANKKLNQAVDSACIELFSSYPINTKNMQFSCVFKKKKT